MNNRGQIIQLPPPRQNTIWKHKDSILTLSRLRGGGGGGAILLAATFNQTNIFNIWANVMKLQDFFRNLSGQIFF